MKLSNCLKTIKQVIWQQFRQLGQNIDDIRSTLRITLSFEAINFICKDLEWMLLHVLALYSCITAFLWSSEVFFFWWPSFMILNRDN